MDLVIFAAIAVAALTVMAIVLFMLTSTKRSMRSTVRTRRPRKASAGVCGICFGTIENDQKAAKCTCGQTFHDHCAEATGKCPYCERPYADLTKPQNDGKVK